MGFVHRLVQTLREWVEGGDGVKGREAEEDIFFPLEYEGKKYHPIHCGINSRGEKWCDFAARGRFGGKEIIRLSEGTFRVDKEGKRVVIVRS